MDVINALIDRGAEINQTDRGQDVLMHVANEGNAELVAELIGLVLILMPGTTTMGLS